MRIILLVLCSLSCILVSAKENEGQWMAPSEVDSQNVCIAFRKDVDVKGRQEDDVLWKGLSGDSMSPWVNSSVFNREMTVFKVGIHEDIIDLYERAIDTASREKVSYQQCLAGIVSMLFALMVYRNRNLHVPDSETANATNRAKAIIRENFYDDMSLEEIARQVNMSYTWFCKQFKVFTGMSPAHYIQELKLQHSKKLLASTDMSIKEISFTLGYDAPSHFTNIFKKHIGCSPLAYRANCRRNLLKPTGGGIIIRKIFFLLSRPYGVRLLSHTSTYNSSISCAVSPVILEIISRDSPSVIIFFAISKAFFCSPFISPLFSAYSISQARSMSAYIALM